MSTSVSEAVHRQVTLATEGLIKSDTPTTVVSCPVDVVCVQSTVEVLGFGCLDSLVNHNDCLIHDELFDTQPATTLHESPSRSEARSPSHQPRSFVELYL